MTPDVNVLVAAALVDHPQHVIARGWMDEHEGRAAAGAPFVLLPVVVTGFVRVATNRRIFATPAPVARALAVVDALLDAPNVHLVRQGAEWPAFAALCREHALSGAAVTDAWIAASVLHHHEQLVTFDRGFRRLLPARNVTVLSS